MRCLLVSLLLIALTGCATTRIIPQPQPGSLIDQDGQRINQTLEGVMVSVQVHESSVRPSPAEQNYASFWVEVSNQRNVQLPLRYSDFLLIDEQGLQYQPVDPEELVDILTDSAAYLIPYPYVGFYYLQDSLRARLDTDFRSEGRYFASRRPEFLAREALPSINLLPGAKVAGAVYFAAELRTMNSFQLRYQIGQLAGQKSYYMTLPFIVEKK
jgi:hypothetical protein